MKVNNLSNKLITTLLLVILSICNISANERDPACTSVCDDDLIVKISGTLSVGTLSIAHAFYRQLPCYTAANWTLLFGPEAYIAATIPCDLAMTTQVVNTSIQAGGALAYALRDYDKCIDKCPFIVEDNTGGGGGCGNCWCDPSLCETCFTCYCNVLYCGDNSNSGCNSCLCDITLCGWDWGDVPDGYGTTYYPNGRSCSVVAGVPRMDGIVDKCGNVTPWD
jgi:hypothetical protein